MTQRVEPLFEYDTKNWTLFFEFDSKNWTFFFEFDSKNWTFFFLNMTRRIDPLFEYDSKNWTSFWVWFKELNLFFVYDSKNWTFFWIWLKELNLFLWIWFKELNQKEKKTQRIEPFWTWLKELNLFFYKTQNWTFSHMTRRIEPFFPYDSKNWTLFLIWFKELLFLIMTQRIQLFFSNLIQRIGLFATTHRLERSF